jgi:mono/diheme cytochrome c family protein
MRRGARKAGIAALALLAIGAIALMLTMRPWLAGRSSGLSAVPTQTPGQVLVAASTASTASTAPSALLARGAYLALAGNCAGCHTARGGEPYAGGRPIATPFGAVYTSNLTPDPETGLGAWSADDFWRAMHEGRSRDGRALTPAFPYTEFTRITRADADAIHAWLRSLPPVRAPNRPNGLRFPWNQPLMTELWQLVYFRSATFVPDDARDAAFNRGAYLVEVLGHCGACHTARDSLGGPDGVVFAGAELAQLGWYAPSLLSDREAAVGRWTQDETVDWLATGINRHAIAAGPMAAVVTGSLQHLQPDDLQSMAVYLNAIALPDSGGPRVQGLGRKLVLPSAGDSMLAAGERLYAKHCAECHGDKGELAAPGYPPLAGNRLFAMNSPVNAIRAVLHGGFAPATPAKPRPFSMPPFGPQLDDREIAAIVSWLRNTWGQRGTRVESRQVNALRSVPVD